MRTQNCTGSSLFGQRAPMGIIMEEVSCSNFESIGVLKNRFVKCGYGFFLYRGMRRIRRGLRCFGRVGHLNQM